MIHTPDPQLFEPIKLVVGCAVLHLHHLLDYKAAIAKRAAPVADLGRCHVALGQEIATQTIGDLAGIDSFVLLFCRSNRPQHHRMRYLHLRGMRKQVIVNPPREDRRLHGDGTLL